MTRPTGTITRSRLSDSDQRVQVHTVHTTLAAVRAAAQSFAYGTPGDGVEFELGDKAGAFVFYPYGPVDQHGHQPGRLFEYSAAGQLINDNAPFERPPIEQRSYDSHAQGL